MRLNPFLSILVFIIAAQISQAQIPESISYQGVLTNPEGAPVADGDYELTFNIYSAAELGSPLWTENYPSIPVISGIFNVILGSTTPLSIPFDIPYWLGITVGAGSELTPRIQFTSAAYSLNARSISDGAVTGAKIAEGQVVRNINGLTDEVILGEGANVTIAPVGNMLLISAAFDGWRLNGNAATNPDDDFLGTIDNVPLNLRVNNLRVLRLESGSTSPNFIGGFSGNLVSGGISGATISGGGEAGMENIVTDDHGTVGGGKGNTIIGSYGTASGGWGNSAGTDSAVGGGGGNIASGSSATVPGGSQNTALGDYSFAAGHRAKANHIGSFVWGDSVDADVTDTGENQFVVRANGGAWFFTGSGGLRVRANTISPNIIGGFGDNTAVPGVVGASIGGGGATTAENMVTDNYGVVGGGKGNVAGDGDTDLISATHATVSGGRDNTANGTYATIGGGWGNTANAFCATIAGGGTAVPGYPDTVNRVTDDYGTVSGGGNNQAGNDTGTTNDAWFATVGGGANNLASGYTATVAGGYDNRATGDGATIGGGGVWDVYGSTSGNRASGYLSTIGGGYLNTASGDNSTIGGGGNNEATGHYATVAGGDANEAVGDYAAIPGGYGNTAGGKDSFAAGRRAKANHDGCFVWGDSTNADIASTGIGQFIVRANGGASFYSNTNTTIYAKTGVYGQSSGEAAVHGYNNGTDGYGVYGYSEGLNGLFGVGGDGVYGSSEFGYGVHGYSDRGTAVYADGDMVATGSKPAEVRLDDGTAVRLFAEESAEIYFTDYGEARLSNGRERIELDPVFLQTVIIDAIHPMKVFVQVEGDCLGVYVTNKTSTGFDVIELQAGSSNAPFSYRVVCKRKYYEDMRLATPEEGANYTNRMIEAVWPDVIATREAERERMGPAEK